jgi:hypothetical protein
MALDFVWDLENFGPISNRPPMHGMGEESHVMHQRRSLKLLTERYPEEVLNELGQARSIVCRWSDGSLSGKNFALRR